jgi:hypothetical protein
MSASPRRAAAWLPLLALCLLASACSRQAPLYPVRGQVVYRGRPLADALVVFHRADGVETGRPMAYTDGQGEFRLTTQVANDGAGAGDYRVTVEWRALVQRGEEKTRSGNNLLPVKYANPATSGLVGQVAPGENVLQPFVLVD